jgi:hypothetical protein
MAEKKKTLGQAIDDIVLALDGLDESTQIVAIKAVCEQLNIRVIQQGQPIIPTHPLAPSENALTLPQSQQSDKITDIRTLKEKKKPTTAIEMACLVAFYLENHASEGDRKNTIKADDIKKYFKQADFPLPKVLSQLLVDAKAAGYFDSPGRGKYRLNPVGHNLVAHSLPKVNKPAV